MYSYFTLVRCTHEKETEVAKKLPHILRIILLAAATIFEKHSQDSYESEMAYLFLKDFAFDPEKLFATGSAQKMLVLAGYDTDEKKKEEIACLWDRMIDLLNATLETDSIKEYARQERISLEK